MQQKGFTLIEFIVIISIFAIMATVALFNFSGFRSNVALSNTAHDIAITLRQAQVFGWSTETQSLDQVTGEPLRYPEGVFFEKDSTGNFTKNFILYTKNNTNPDNAFFEGASLDRVMDILTIQGALGISDIRTSMSKDDLRLDQQNANTIVGGTSVSNSVSIVFSRPKLEALFFDGVNPISDQFVGIYVATENRCPAGTSCISADHVILISKFGEIEVQ